MAALPLVRERVDARLVVAGTFMEPMERYVEQVRALGVEPHVTFIPDYVADEHVPGLFARCDVVALPYRTRDRQRRARRGRGRGQARRRHRRRPAPRDGRRARRPRAAARPAGARGRPRARAPGSAAAPRVDDGAWTRWRDFVLRSAGARGVTCAPPQDHRRRPAAGARGRAARRGRAPLHGGAPRPARHARAPPPDGAVARGGRVLRRRRRERRRRPAAHGRVRAARPSRRVRAAARAGRALAREFPGVDVRNAAVSDDRARRPSTACRGREHAQLARALDAPPSRWSRSPSRVAALTPRCPRTSRRAGEDRRRGRRGAGARGAAETLARHRPTVVFEHDKSSRHFGTTSATIVGLLAAAGLRVFDIKGRGPYDGAALERAVDAGRWTSSPPLSAAGAQGTRIRRSSARR